MTSHRQEGGCQCGAVRYRTSDRPVRVIAGHCAACKRRTGAAYGIGVYLQDTDVEFTQGTMRTYEFHSDESGRWLRNEFCDKCGATVSWTLELRPVSGQSLAVPMTIRVGLIFKPTSGHNRPVPTCAIQIMSRCSRRHYHQDKDWNHHALGVYALASAHHVERG